MESVTATGRRRLSEDWSEWDDDDPYLEVLDGSWLTMRTIAPHSTPSCDRVPTRASSTSSAVLQKGAARLASRGE